MGTKKSWFFICLTLFLFSCSSDQSLDYLDNVLQDSAFTALIHFRPHTGALYRATLPSNFSGIDLSVLRLRSRNFWLRGANFSAFSIPSRTMTVPYVKRLGIVFQDLGNWSSHFYTVPGYKLITPVVGFVVYDASNLGAKRLPKLDLHTMGKPVSIRFCFVNSSVPDRARAQCVAFGGNGTVSLSEMRQPCGCHSHGQGHFAIVVPLKRRHKAWKLWVLGIVVGFVGVGLVGILVGMVIVRVFKSKRIEEMEKQADDDSVLEMVWIGRSKMPSATITRTQPVLENGHFP